MTDFSTYAPSLLMVGIFVALFAIFGSTSKVARAIASVSCIAVSMRYLYWRVTLPPSSHQNLAQFTYTRFFLLVEICTVASSMFVYFFMSRTVDRSAQATLHQNSVLQTASSDVFIASYNESRDILERTIIGALAIDHPDLRVWLLDDGARPWAEILAQDLGIQYISRKNGTHAKAGNINNALDHALKTDRRPQFLLLLDADFIPHRNILRRTLGLFDDATVGIVQTPQHFFNADPIQSNLQCGHIWPDEQRFFFNALLPSKDAWGAAFCCGTSAVFRVDALVEAGGMATETVTEDMLTTFKFDAVGYRTIFLNERLSLGLAPESLVDFISQRSRWCLGAIQQLFTRYSFFGSAKISFINRLGYFDSFLHWTSAAAFRVLVVTAPVIYWFTGTAPFQATAADLIFWLGPLVLANLLFMRFLAGNRILPVMSDIIQLLVAFVICRTVITALIRPFGRPFKVTAKGLSSTSITVQWSILWKFAALSAATVLGIALHLSRYDALHASHDYTFIVLGSLCSAATLALAAAACIELPHRRRDERFSSQETASVHLRARTEQNSPGSCSFSCIVSDLSLGGASLILTSDVPSDGDGIPQNAYLLLSDGRNGELELPFVVRARGKHSLTIEFDSADWIRHALIRKLFTGDYDKEVHEIHAGKVFFSLVRLLTS